MKYEEITEPLTACSQSLFIHQQLPPILKQSRDITFDHRHNRLTKTWTLMLLLNIYFRFDSTNNPAAYVLSIPTVFQVPGIPWISQNIRMCEDTLVNSGRPDSQKKKK